MVTIFLPVAKAALSYLAVSETERPLLSRKGAFLVINKSVVQKQFRDISPHLCKLAELLTVR